MKKMTKSAAIFSILMGVAMFLTWTVVFATGKVPEMSTQPVSTSLLLVAEFLTASSLIASGSGILAGRRWGSWTNSAALGMLLYCVINFASVLAEQGIWQAVIFFTVVAVVSAVFIGYFAHQFSRKNAAYTH